MKITQVELERDGKYLVCWIPAEEVKLRKGLRLELKDEGGVWTVSNVYSTQEHYELNRRWDVGGL